MTINYSFNRDIPVIGETDVLVIGGGPGGFSAAVMAARQGVKVMLAERSNAPGGMAYLGEISPFMSNHISDVTLDAPLYADWNFEMWKLKGLPEAEFSRDVVQNTPLSKEISMLAAEKLLENAGVETLYHHTFFDVVMEDESIKSVIFHSKSGLCAIKAKAVVDSTGDGDVAAFAGAEFLMGDSDGNLQAATHCFELGGVNTEQYVNGVNMHNGNPSSPIYTILESGEFPEITEPHLCQSLIKPGVVGFNAGHIWKVDPTKPETVSEALYTGRKMAEA